MQPDLRAECLAMAERGDAGALHPQEAAALLRRVADALPQEPKGDVVEAVRSAILRSIGGKLVYTDSETVARAALSAAEPFIQARIAAAVEDGGWQRIETAPKDGFFLGLSCADDVPEVWAARQYWLCMAPNPRPGLPVQDARMLTMFLMLPPPPGEAAHTSIQD